MQGEAVAVRLRAWGDCRVLGNLHGGHRNAVLLVERGGRKFVAKGSRRSPEAIAWLEPVQEMARAAGFIVPHFVPSEAGALIVDGVTLETWIESSSPSSSDLASLDDGIRRFHRLTTSCHQRPGFVSTLDLVHRDRGGEVDLTLMPLELLEVCRSAWLALSGRSVSAVHGDLNSTNVLVTPEGRFALIDWDEARTDVSALDRAALARATDSHEQDQAFQALLAWEVATSWTLEPEYARRLARDLLKGL